jgi:hypothetical protein
VRQRLDADRNTGTTPPAQLEPCTATPSKIQLSGMVYEYARMLKIGSITDTFRVPPAGGAAATEGRAVNSIPKISDTFTNVRLKFITPPTAAAHYRPAWKAPQRIISRELKKHHL